MTTQYRITVNSVNGQRIYFSNTIPHVLTDTANYFQKFVLDDYPNKELDLLDSCYFWNGNIIPWDEDYALSFENVPGTDPDSLLIKELSFNIGDLIFYNHHVLKPGGFEVSIVNSTTAIEFFLKTYPSVGDFGELIIMDQNFTGNLLFKYGSGEFIFDDLLVQSNFNLNSDKPFCGDISFSEFSSSRNGDGTFTVSILTSKEENGINIVLERNLNPDQPGSPWHLVSVFDIANNVSGNEYTIIDGLD